MKHLTTRAIAASSLALAAMLAPTSAQAEDCAGWFCDDAPAKAPAPSAADPATAAPASESPGSITLPSGDILTGTITELVPGDHVTIRTPVGVSIRLSWSLVSGIKVGGSVSAGGATTPAPTPVAPPPRAPRIVYAPVPVTPAAVYSTPPVPAPIATRDQPCVGGDCPWRRPAGGGSNWVLGARIGVLGPSGDSELGGGRGKVSQYLGAGVGLETSIGFRLGANWTPYVAYQLAGFGTGNANSGASGDVLSHMLLGGIRADTNPRGLGLLVDLGIGYRWLSIPMNTATPYSYGSRTVYGYGGSHGTVFEGLTGRGSLGVAFGSPRLRWDLSFDLAIGALNSGGGDSACGGYACYSASKGSYTFAGLSLGGRFGI